MLYPTGVHPGPAASGEWQAPMVPSHIGGAVHRLRFYYRRRRTGAMIFQAMENIPMPPLRSLAGEANQGFLV